VANSGNKNPGKPPSRGSGKTSSTGGKPPAKRGDAKPARGRTPQKPGRQPSRAKAAPKERRGLGKFLRDVRVELGKVTWPTRRDLGQSFLVVLVAVAIAAIYVGVLDFGFSKIVDTVVKLIT
jgi:preprotein translocase subunit SecE